MVYRDEILVIIIKQFNIIIKGYFIKILNEEFEFWEKILRILDIEVWQNNPNNNFKKNVEFRGHKLVKK